MILAGFVIAIGVVVDDAIIDVENIVRRLREDAARPADQRRAADDVIFEASREVRGSIVFATLIVMLVFVPLFFLDGVEGRLLRPLGVAYLVAIFASLVVALTLTPALCSYVLPRRAAAAAHGDAWLVRTLKRGYRPVLVRAVRRPAVVIIGALTVSAPSLNSGRNVRPRNGPTATAAASIASAPMITTAGRRTARTSTCLLYTSPSPRD